MVKTQQLLEEHHLFFMLGDVPPKFGGKCLFSHGQLPYFALMFMVAGATAKDLWFGFGSGNGQV